MPVSLQRVLTFFLADKNLSIDSEEVKKYDWFAIRTIVQVSSGKYLFLKISEICKKRIRSCLNKDTRTVLFTSCWCCYCELWTFFTPFFGVSFADFEHVSVSWKSSSLYNFDLFMFFDTWKTKSTYICQFRSSCSGQSKCNFGSRM